LFGAGAEVQFGLSNGGDFAKKVLGINDETTSLNNAISKFYSGIEKDNDWYPNYNAAKWNHEDILKAALKKQWLSSQDQSHKRYEFENYVNESVKKLSVSEQNELLKKYPSYMGILDERFHTLISPSALGPNKFWSVVTCYWRAYLALARQLIPEDFDVEWIMNNPSDAYEEMSKTAKSYRKEASYYKIIREYSKFSEIHVITTNYTPLCAAITELSDKYNKKSIAYVNGSFMWFERAREMRVLDVTHEEDDFSKKDYFPFIFLQSGVKPIVCSTQIREWTNAVSFLDNDSKLIIVGYRLSCDDNHLNSLIREYIVKGGNTYYFSFEGNIKEDEVLKSLRLQAKPDNLTVVEINNENALDIFENCLSDGIN
jgi:hypothetical protein